MRASAFETISPNAPITALPARLELTASRVSPILVLTLVLPFALLALIPFFMITQHPEAPALIAHVETSIPLGIALLAWTLLFGWPIASALPKLGRRQTVLIRPGMVRVCERSAFANSAWSAPLNSYIGLAHHVRASLSGTRHELILVHPNPARSVLVRMSPAISQREIDDLAQVLGCREIVPRIFYSKANLAAKELGGARATLAAVAST